jgi:hypothetical protein
LAIAGEFNLVNDSSIAGIQSYFNIVTPGNMKIAVYSDAGDLPGSELFSTSISFAAVDGNPAWRGVSGLDWDLPGGTTYWVGFRADATLTFGTPVTVFGSGGGAPNPFGNEARLYDGGFAGFYWFGDDSLDFGVRITGNNVRTDVPEAGSTLGLTTIGLAAMAGFLKLTVA